jgi:hypothetical protein
MVEPDIRHFYRRESLLANTPYILTFYVEIGKKNFWGGFFYKHMSIKNFFPDDILLFKNYVFIPSLLDPNP